MFTHFKRMTWRASLLTTIISLLAFTVALAASGDLDGSFDGDGLVTSYVVPSDPGRHDLVQGIAIQANGKIVAVGFSYPPQDFAVTRYNTNGSLDTTFSGDGRLITNFGGDDAAYDVAVQSNGKIVVAGQKCISGGGACDVALARYNANGTLDITFSSDGKQTTNFGAGDNGARGLAIQSDGKIVLSGYMWNGTDFDFVIYRYNSNGSLDTTFSGNGIAYGNFGIGRQETVKAIALQSDGKILVAGYTADSNFANQDIAVARLNPNGTADATFSGDGRQSTNFGASDYALGMALQPDGKIVVVGSKCTTICYFAMARYNMNGNLDNTFNSTGRKVFSVTVGESSQANDVIVQANGKIVVLGQTNNGEFSDFALVRLNNSSAFDTTFSTDGKVTVDFGGYDVGLALALQPSDGKYVLAGGDIDIYTGPQDDFALARVLP